MTDVFEKKVTVFGKEVSLSLPTQKKLLSSMEKYSNSFDLGSNLVLHIVVQPNGDFPSNYITTRISTVEGVYIYRHNVGPIPDEKLFDVIQHEIDWLIENLPRDFSIAYKRAEECFSALNKVNEMIGGKSNEGRGEPSI